jgi:hypothetical protein
MLHTGIGKTQGQRVKRCYQNDHLHVSACNNTWGYPIGCLTGPHHNLFQPPTQNDSHRLSLLAIGLSNHEITISP